MLNTFNGVKQALSIYPHGGHVKMDFNIPGNVEIYQSCSLVFQDKMYVFGGNQKHRQIAEVSLKCGIDRLGDLPFDFVNGACTVIKDDEIMLCFDFKELDQGRVCRIDKSPTGSLDKINKDSNFTHYRARIAANDGET